MKSSGVYSISMILLLFCSASADNHLLRSPDERVGVSISDSSGQLKYSISVEGKEVIAPSRLGMRIDGKAEGRVWTIRKKEPRSVDEVWEPIAGKRAEVRNRFNELTLTLDDDNAVIFRAYDEGVAFRYILAGEESETGDLTVLEELSEINVSPFGANAEAWSFQNERRPKGPERISTFSGRRHYPLVIKRSDDQWLAITEAALHNFDYFDLTFTEGESKARFTIDPCDVTPPFKTPWRVIMIAESPEVFVDSDLLVNLSPPPQGDFSWVKPGVALWDWRAWGHQTKDGFTYDLNMESWKRFIDFAAEQEVPYLLLDANWYGPEHSTLSDPFKGGKAGQVKQALDYGKEKGVGLILYLNDKASVNFSIEEVAKAYAEWGAVGIKYGFMKGKNQDKVRKTERIVKACAENRLLVNFHDGPIPPTGHERTWPNWNTREYVHAQSDAKRAHSPGDFVHMAYLNTIAGPIDGNHGLFDHEHSLEQRPRIFQEVESTIVAEAARTLILYSGLTVIPDSPDSYREHPELFEFIADQKQPWQQSRTLAGEFGKWITTMRQAKDGTYLVATATDESARTVSIPLDFLETGKTYEMTVFQDAADAHCQTNRSAYTVAHREVTASDTVEAHLAPGGGHCLMIKPSSEYVLVWADEFEQDGRLAPENWTFEHGFVRNRELQWYQQDNTFCEKKGQPEIFRISQPATF